MLLFFSRLWCRNSLKALCTLFLTFSVKTTILTSISRKIRKNLEFPHCEKYSTHDECLYITFIIMLRYSLVEQIVEIAGFSAIQILREINFGVSRRSKTVVFEFPEDLNLDFKKFLQFWRALKLQKCHFLNS